MGFVEDAAWFGSFCQRRMVQETEHHRVTEQLACAFSGGKSAQAVHQLHQCRCTAWLAVGGMGDVVEEIAKPCFQEYAHVRCVIAGSNVIIRGLM